MSRYLKVNDVLIDSKGSRIVLNINTKHDRVEYLSVEENSNGHLSLKGLRRQMALGEVWLDASPSVTGTMRRSGDNSCAYKAFLFRIAVAKKINAVTRTGTSLNKAIKSLRGTVITTSTGESFAMCSVSQAYRIIRLARTSESALMPSYDCRGNRTPRYSERIKEITLELTQRKYATKKSAITIKGLTDLVNHAAHTEGVLAEDQEVSRKFVRTLIVNEWHPDLDHKRIDPRIAKSAKAVACTRIRPGAPLNRVEIDTMHLPILAKSDYGVAENIHVMLAIDCETSHPLAWWFMLTKPTTEDTYSCIERAIYPKADLLTSMGVGFDVDPYGTILNLVMDNGQENSKQRLAAVTRVGINPQWTEVDSGHRKPFIERLNRSMKTALEKLPGCTRFEGKDGGRIESAKADALLSVAELERWVARWLFESWPHTQLERFVTADYEIEGGLGLTPADRWRNYEEREVLPICPQHEDWRRCRFLEIERSISHKTGVSCEGFDFRGANLKTLIAMYGPNATVAVHYNPHDYRTIYVPDKSGQWLELINAEVTDATPAFSFADAKSRRRALKSTHTRSQMAKSFDSDLNSLALERPKKKTRAESLRGAHQTTRSADAVRRAQTAPLERLPVVNVVDDSYVLEDTIPNFTIHHTVARNK